MERALMRVPSSLSIMEAPTMYSPFTRGTTYTGSRGCSTRTGRLSASSGRRSSSISPFTPRKSASSPRAARPLQSITARPARGSACTSTPKRMLTPSSLSLCTSALSAARGSRCASAAKYSARLKRPLSSGSRTASSSPVSSRDCAVRRANCCSSARSRPCATTSVPLVTVAGKRSRHQGMLSAPSCTMRAVELSSSHQGASMPPANQEQPAAASSPWRSSTSTCAPRSASSSAQVSPATPAPITVTRMASEVLTARTHRFGHRVRRHVQFPTGGAELLRHVAHSLRPRLGPYLVRDAHGAEFRSAHGTEMRHLVPFLGQGGIVEGAGGIRIERQVELVSPTKIKARPRQRVVSGARARVTLGKIRRERCDLVGDNAGLDVVAIRQSQVLLGRDVAQHRRAEPADHGCADGGGDVVVTGCDVSRQRTQGVERRLATDRELLVHILLDLVHRDMSRALDHHLAVVPPGDLGQLSQGLKLGKLRGIVGIRDGTGPQTVAERETHIVAAADLADLLEVLVEEALAVMRQTPLRHDGAATRHDARDTVHRERHVRQAHAGVDGEVIHALLCLLDERVAEDFPG